MQQGSSLGYSQMREQMKITNVKFGATAHRCEIWRNASRSEFRCKQHGSCHFNKHRCAIRCNAHQCAIRCKWSRCAFRLKQHGSCHFVTYRCAIWYNVHRSGNQCNARRCAIQSNPAPSTIQGADCIINQRPLNKGALQYKNFKGEDISLTQLCTLKNEHHRCNGARSSHALLKSAQKPAIQADNVNVATPSRANVQFGAPTHADVQFSATGVDVQFGTQHDGKLKARQHTQK